MTTEVTKTKANYAGAASGVGTSAVILSLFWIGPKIGLITPSVEDATSAYVVVGTTIVGGAITGGLAWLNTWRAPPNVPVDPKLQMVVEPVADSKAPTSKVVGSKGTKVGSHAWLLLPLLLLFGCVPAPSTPGQPPEQSWLTRYCAASTPALRAALRGQLGLAPEVEMLCARTADGPVLVVQSEMPPGPHSDPAVIAP